jgi:hypothetical protein
MYQVQNRLLIAENGQEYENISEVVLGDATFYLKVPEKYLGSLNLLEQGVENAEQAYQLHQLLQVLKSRTFVIAVDNEGCEYEGSAARAKFLAALQEKEQLHAFNLRERLQDEGVDW